MRGRALIPWAHATDLAGRCCTAHRLSSTLDPGGELLAHERGWIWAVYYTDGKARSHFALIHSDGTPLARAVVDEVISSDRACGGLLHARLNCLNPPANTEGEPDSAVLAAYAKYSGRRVWVHPARRATGGPGRWPRGGSGLRKTCSSRSTWMSRPGRGGCRTAARRQVPGHPRCNSPSWQFHLGVASPPSSSGSASLMWTRRAANRSPMIYRTATGSPCSSGVASSAIWPAVRSRIWSTRSPSGRGYERTRRRSARTSIACYWPARRCCWWTGSTRSRIPATGPPS